MNGLISITETTTTDEIRAALDQMSWNGGKEILNIF